MRSFAVLCLCATITHAQIPVLEQNIYYPDCENVHLHGLWSDGETMWVAELWANDKIYAYDFASKQHVPEKDFDGMREDGNELPWGIWSDGETIWVSDFGGGKIYAYDLVSKTRTPEQDFNILIDAGNKSPLGLWSDGETMWIVDSRFGNSKIYAYDLNTKERVPEEDFDTLVDAGNNRPEGLWSDGEIMWVVDIASKIYAYDLASKAHVPERDFDTSREAGNTDPRGIWSDGETMWVSDVQDRTLYAYTLPGASRVNPVNPDRLNRPPICPPPVKPSLKLSVAGAPVELSFFAEIGATYQLQTSRDLVRWAAANQVTATSDFIIFEDFVANEARRFYRVSRIEAN